MKWILLLCITGGGWFMSWVNAQEVERLQMRLANKQDKCTVGDVASSEYREIRGWFDGE